MLLGSEPKLVLHQKRYWFLIFQRVKYPSAQIMDSLKEKTKGKRGELIIHWPIIILFDSGILGNKEIQFKPVKSPGCCKYNNFIRLILQHLQFISIDTI